MQRRQYPILKRCLIQYELCIISSFIILENDYFLIELRFSTKGTIAHFYCRKNITNWTLLNLEKTSSTLYSSDEGFKGTVLKRALASLHGWSITWHYANSLYKETAGIISGYPRIVEWHFCMKGYFKIRLQSL